MSKFSRAVAMLLCIALVLGMCPSFVFATEQEQPQSINFLDPAEASKFTVVNQLDTKIKEDEGLYLISTTDAVEPCNDRVSTFNAKDLVTIPAEGDWTATIKFKFDQGSSRGWYEFFGFYAMDDYDNMVGIRAGDGAIQDFLRQNSNVKADTDGIKTTSGLKSANTHWLRIAKTGDDYVCYWSTDGVTFTKTFSYEDTGITGNTIALDAYSGMATGYNYTIEYLYFGDDTDAMNQTAVDNAADVLAKKIPADIPLKVDDTYSLPKGLAGYTATYSAVPDCVTEAGKMTALADETEVAVTMTVSGLGKTATRTMNVKLPAAGTGTAPAVTYMVTFNPNVSGLDSVKVEVPEGELVEVPEGLTRPGYKATWRNGNANFDFSTPITSDLTLTANWEKDWKSVPSLSGEYADYFPVGSFGGQIGNAQTDYHYRTLSGNNGKLTYNIGSSNTNSVSRQVYLQKVAEINADTSLTEEEKAAQIELANQDIQLVTNEPALFSTLRAIRQWNEQHPDEPKKYYRQHVLAWHGSEQPNYFYCNGFYYDASNPDWASPETMLARLDNYIRKMMERYVQFDDVILSWDVVNEAIDDYTGQCRNAEGYQVSNWGRIFRHPELDDDPDARLYAETEWVRQAFESARKWTEYYGGHWTLYYNDFQDSNKLYEPKMSQTIKMLEPIYEAGNIDGYGMQARLSYAYPSIDMLREQIELGLTVANEISFSEADIRSDFEPNPNYDPEQPTRRVVEGDPEWPANSGSYTNISRSNGNTFDVHNSPVYRNPNWSVSSLSSLATDPEIMKKQADYAADLMDLVLEYKDQFGAVAWDGYRDNSTFNGTTGCQMWDSSSNEKYSFFAIIGAPNRLKMREAIAAGPTVDEQAQYSAETWAVYAEALAEAEALVDVRIYDLDGVNAVKAATANLEAATEALAPANQIPIYEDTSYSFAERAADLVARMSVAQKGSQMISTAPAINAADLGGGALNTVATKSISSYEWWSEALHGYSRGNTSNATSYPQNLSAGSTWNPDLYYQQALQISEEIRERTNKNSLGNAINLNFYSPTVNMQRDPRWGRNEESYSEDPLLTSAMGTQFVLGLEGKNQDGTMIDPNGYYRAHATVKHYVANNSERNRLDGGATTDLRALREYYAAPYRNVIQAADVSSVMTAYSTLNGEPCSYSSYLMDTLLRQTFGLSGYVTSDCDSASTIARHKYVNPYTGKVLTNVEQMSGALAHGEDLECSGGYNSGVGTYSSLATSMVNSGVQTDKGIFTENSMDVSLLRLMTARISTGEFDDDLALTAEANARIEAQKAAKPDDTLYNQTTERLAIAEQMATESVVLLKNDGILPLNVGSGAFTVAIVGDWQTNTYLGLYSNNPGNGNRVNIQQGIVNALTRINPNVEFNLIASNTLTAEDEAAIAAANAAIVVTGTNNSYSAEDRDRTTIALPNGQADLISKVGKLNENTIAVMETCGPMQVTTFENDVKAILWSSFEGIRKVGFGAVISGAVNPSGHLTSTWHQNVSDNGVSDIPSILNYNMYNTNGDSGRTYMYYNGETPVSYPFGYGLSYTTFEYSNLKIDKTSYDANDTVTVTFDVTNTGSVAGMEVSQLYIAQPDAPAELLRPIRRLEGFKKISLDPNETKTVTMEVSIPELAFYNEEADCYMVDTGLYQVQVGEDSAHANLTTNFTVSGEMDVYPEILTVKACQAGDPEQGIEERVIFEKGQTIVPQLTVAMNNEKLYGYIIANQNSPIKQLKSTALPEGMTFTYSSNRPSVVKVVGDEIKAVGPGVATITVTGTLDDHVVTAEFVAYVEATALLDGITIDGKPLEGFARERFNYELSSADYAKVPTVAAVSNNDDLVVTVEQADAIPGVAVINVLNVSSNSSTTYRIGFGGNPVSTNFAEGWAAAEAKGWTVANATDNAVFGENGLTITGEQGKIGTETPLKNLYTEGGCGTWVAQTHMTLAEDLTDNNQRAGMIVYDNESNYIEFVYERVTTSSWGGTRVSKVVRVYSVANGERTQVATVTLSGTNTNLWFQIVKQDANYQFNYSTNGTVWKAMNGKANNSMAFPQIGVFASTGTSDTAPAVVATFNGINISKVSDLYPRLATLTVDGETVPGFDAEKFTYNFVVDVNETKAPVVAATSVDPEHSVEITQLDSAHGTATVKVTSSAASATYSLSFNHMPLSDYFADGTISDNWTVEREDKETYRLVQGEGLVMPTQTGDIHGTGDNWKNVFTTPAAGNWEVVAKVFYPQIPKANYQQAMLLVWQDANNYIRLNCQQSSLRLEPGVEINGSFAASGLSQAYAEAAEDGTVTLYFKIEKDGTNYTASYSQDGLNFNKLGTVKNVDFANPRIGLFCAQNSSSAQIELDFEYVAVTWLNGVEQMGYADMLTWAAQNAADYIAAALPESTSENLTLANAPHGYTVELISSDPSVIAADGTVTPAATDKTVNVTVKVSEGETVATSTVAITVPAGGSVELPELAIVTEPASFEGKVGDTATFTVAANRDDVTYQWMYSNNGGKFWSKSSMAGSTTASLSVLMKASRVGQMYKVVVTDSEGNTVESAVVSMTTASTLAIVENPADSTVAVNATAAFTVKAEGEGLTYQWMYSNNGGASWSKSSMAGYNTATISVVAKTYRAGQMYKCVVTDASGNVVESTAATLNIG